VSFLPLLVVLLASQTDPPLGGCERVLSYVAAPSDELIISEWRPAEPTCQRGNVVLTIHNRSTKAVTGASFLVARDQTCSKAPANSADLGVRLPEGTVLAPQKSTTLELSAWLLSSSRGDAERCKRPGAFLTLSEVTFSDGSKRPPDRIGPALQRRCEGKRTRECARRLRHAEPR
jgi:hypothetical protein